MLAGTSSPPAPTCCMYSGASVLTRSAYVAACLRRTGVNGSPGLQFASTSMRADAMSIDPA